MKHFVTALLMLASLVGCGDDASSLPDDAYQAEADIAVVMSIAAVTADDAANNDDGKPDRKPGDKCDNCDGSGRSGDGIGRCKVCSGDGRIDEQDLRSALVTGTSLPSKKSSPPRTVDSNPETSPNEPAPITPVKIVLHVSPDSIKGWPKLWWDQDRQFFFDLGHEIPPPVRHQTGGSWIQVCGSEKCVRIDGHPSRQQLLDVIEKVK